LLGWTLLGGRHVLLKHADCLNFSVFDSLLFVSHNLVVWIVVETLFSLTLELLD
jgi:hypothetical protein